MPVIDKSYFTGELFIPNAVAVPDIQLGNPTNEDKLTNAIAKYEKMLLVNALGITQYNALVANISAPSGKWYDLINGKDYEGKRFDGLKNIIAYFVYVHFLKYDNVQYTTVGLERSNAKNSTSVSPTERLVDYWNTFVHLYQNYPECGCPFVFRYWNFGTNEYKETFVSLYQYLTENSTDYDARYFKAYRIQNVIGI